MHIDLRSPQAGNCAISTLTISTLTISTCAGFELHW